MKKNRLSILTAGIIVMLLAVFFSCTKKEVVTPAYQVSPGQGASKSVVTITGSGLKDLRTIAFDNGNVTAAFNPVFNTDGAIIFRVPDDAIPGDQHIVFTNANGYQYSVPFKVLGLPTIISVDNYNFNEGSTITITGKNLDDVLEVKFTGSGEVCGIVSKTATSLVITMPATTKYRTFLDITNQAGTVTTLEEFVSLANNFKFFDDAYQNGEQDAAWGDAGFISTSVFKTGTASYGKNYQRGNWHQMGFGWNNITNDNYKYLSFWIKGGTVNIDVWVWSQQSPGASDPFNNAGQKITVPANVWTYYKIPISQLNLWANGTGFNQLGWRLKGPDVQDEILYLDDVMLVK
ncbi:MAG: IPT/TIG domain-containing protein [Chitinophagaceae bacterium]|nr:IPT/TIG domain-containing protein [Chitinophagaceae bacterium]